MIKQKRAQKMTVLGKRRVNLQKLEQRVVQLERLQKQQARCNQHLNGRGAIMDLMFDDIQERLVALERQHVASVGEETKNRTFMQWLLAKLS